MPLGNGDKLLIKAMANYGATEDEMVGMMTVLETKDQKKEMLLWLYNNPKPTRQQMVQRALIISGIKQ